MMNENENTKPASKVALVSKLGLKCTLIAVLAALLLIPTCSVQSLIRERERSADDVIDEVSKQWCGKQTVVAPCLSVSKSFVVSSPVTTSSDGDAASDENVAEELEVVGQTVKKAVRTQRVTKKMNLLPHNVSITGSIGTSELKRSIYKVVTYEAPLTITGDFKLTEEEIQSLGLVEKEAELDFAVYNLKGIADEVSILFGDKRVVLTPNGLGLGGSCRKLSAKVDISDLLAGKSVPFSMSVSLKGSRSLSFIPVGQNTTVDLKSDWHSPSFNGNFLPDKRKVGKDGFTASWKVSYINRSYPQVFESTSNLDSEIRNSAFGADLILPVQHYQQSMRTAKYAALFIFLTFAIFFFIEVMNKKSIHPIQYLFVGLALCVFYCLLLSLSEHVGFVWAYALSTLMTIVMITLYAIAILRIKKTACYIGAALGGLYAYIFVLIQMETYALLAGSLGLFAILGLLMYFSQRINWNNAD
ncbi:MAG: cell envelope integrity protein CreD [Paludibacteraceae bacterium]|nr:cell envelope integrity protein CreD [Paludibacteraceae bacterium]